MRFDEALRYLLGLGHETLAVKLGLRNTELLLAALGDPHTRYQKVQIAGTNGKGSTAVVLASICLAANIRCGMFTSPHLRSITERIKIDGKDISEENFSLIASEVRAAAEQLVNNVTLSSLPTFFEHVTAIALVAFRQALVEVAILETGLGGRLDSTTAAGADLVAITPIALDHMEFLGNTLESVAAEKAAIIRPGVQAIIAPQEPQALAQIQLQAERSGVALSVDDCEIEVHGSFDDGRFNATFRTPEDTYSQVRLGLRGRHQVTNVAVAIRLAEFLRPRGFKVPKGSIIRGIELAQHSGRLELFSGRPSYLLDGAHNYSGALALRGYLDEFVRRDLSIVFGVMRDKDIGAIAEVLFPRADRLVLVEPDSPRAAKVTKLQEIATEFLGSEKVFVASGPDEALAIARSQTSRDGLVCITGSLYLIGQIRHLILDKE